MLYNNKLNEYEKEIYDRFNSFHSYDLRDKMVQKYAWAIPNEQAISKLVELSPLIEIGAGAGYWAKLVEEAGGKIVCYDIEPPLTQWHPIWKSEPHVIKQRYILRTLFLCWPPYEESMAADCLKLYKGRTLVYVGEGYGGCTGDDNFHEELKNNWLLCDRLEIPQWYGIHDSMYIYKRK